MKRLFAVTLTAVLTLVISARAASAAPIPPPDGPELEKIVPLAIFSVSEDGTTTPIRLPSAEEIAECEEGVGNSFCPQSVTVDGITCPLVFGISVFVGAQVRIGPFLITVVVGAMVCDYGECGIFGAAGTIIIISLA